MKATTTVPIVMTIGVEPVATRLVQSLTKPDGNVTGLTFDVDPEQLAAKRLANRALQRTGARVARPPATERERLDGVRVSESA
jgi:hypothetical protein